MSRIVPLSARGEGTWHLFLFVFVSVFVFEKVHRLEAPGQRVSFNVPAPHLWSLGRLHGHNQKGQVERTAGIAGCAVKQLLSFE